MPNTENDSQKRWLFLLYLCDDYEQLARETEDLSQLDDRVDTLLEAIQVIEGIDKLRTPVDVVYQFDSFRDIELEHFRPPDGTPRQEFKDKQDQHCIRRYLRWQGKQRHGGAEGSRREDSHWQVVRHASYNTMDTGKTQTLQEFFEWARHPIAEAEGIVVAFAGIGVGDKQSIIGNVEANSDYGRLFSICDDKSAKDALNPIEVQHALEMLVNDYRDGEPIDVLGFDMSSMQYVEIAYQFMGLARTVVASQNNDFDPFWPYASLLQQMAQLVGRKKSNGNYIGPQDTGPLFVEAIGRKLDEFSLRSSYSLDQRPIVTAIDVSQLDVLARSMDTLFLNLLQSLGDDAIWVARDAVFRDLKRFHQRTADNTRQTRTLVSYDLRQMLLKLKEHLQDICDASGVLDSWLSEQLRELYDPDVGDQYFDRRVRTVVAADASDPKSQIDKSRRELRRQVSDFLQKRRGKEEAVGPSRKSESRVERSRLWRQLQLMIREFEPDECNPFNVELNLYFPDLDEYERKGNSVSDLEQYPRRKADKFTFDSADPAGLLHVTKALDDAKAFLHRLKERFERLSPQQLERSAATAKHLLTITEDVISLVATPTESKSSNLPGFRRLVRSDAAESETQRCILAQYAFGESRHSSDSTHREQSQCGLSIYRPEHLDRLADSQYLDFAFHRRVHWVSLLAAINLVRKHPGQLWNVVSSLLSTCTGAGRDEMLQRLAGPSSVVDGFGRQFRALQSPLTFTLTVTENRGQDQNVSEQRNSSADGHVSQSVKLDEGVTYKLTLETNRQDAFVDSGTSSLSRRRAEQTLKRLEAIIAPRNASRQTVESLEDFARDLGEDIFQGIDLHLRRDEMDVVPHLHLQLPIELMGLPWEVMNEGRRTRDGRKSRMLCERFAMSRQALIDSGLATSPRSRTSPKIRVLIIGDPRLGATVMEEYGARPLPEAVDEAREVEQLFRQLARDLRGTIGLEESDIQINTEITGHDFRKLLRDGKYDIIHFAGHAMHDEASPDRSGWLLSDGKLWASEIANTLNNCHSAPWLVYANACESGMNSSTQAKYRTNVYGLGTAFTNNGVTAYLGPLWPIGDFVAGQMATDFYKCLLLERETIGESLFVAKRNAKQRLEGALAGDLSWASMILYGDSRMKLLDSVGVDPPAKSGSRVRDSQESADEASFEYERLRRLSKFSSTGQPIQPMQSSVRSTRDDIDKHSICRAAHSHSERMARLEEQEVALELRQIHGLRFWQFMGHGDDEFRGLPNSPLKNDVESNQRLQFRLGIRSSISIDEDSRLVGHWRVPMTSARNFEQTLADLDSTSVNKEGLVSIDRESKLGYFDARGIRRLSRKIHKQVNGKVLLLVHDGLGTTESMVQMLGEDFIRRASREYAAILGFDHWSLQRTVIQSGMQLRNELAAIFPQVDGSGKKVYREDAIDIIGLGRGGLVARALTEHVANATTQGVWSKRVGSIALVGTPNFGSRLSKPLEPRQDDNTTEERFCWGQAADMLANCVHLDSTGTYAKLSCALAQLAAVAVCNNVSEKELSRYANRLAMFDEELEGTFSPPEGVRYSAVAASYGPSASVSVLRIIQDCCDMDECYRKSHDLVVATDDVWARTKRADSSHRTYWKSIPSLLIEPHDDMFYSEPMEGDGQNTIAPAHTDHVTRDGVHHTNLLTDISCQRFLQKHLFEAGIDP